MGSCRGIRVGCFRRSDRGWPGHRPGRVLARDLCPKFRIPQGDHGLCEPAPLPVAKPMPGCCFTFAVSSASVLTPSDGLAASAIGCVEFDHRHQVLQGIEVHLIHERVAADGIRSDQHRVAIRRAFRRRTRCRCCRWRPTYCRSRPAGRARATDDRRRRARRHRSSRPPRKRHDEVIGRGPANPPPLAAEGSEKHERQSKSNNEAQFQHSHNFSALSLPARYGILSFVRAMQEHRCSS